MESLIHRNESLHRKLIYTEEFKSLIRDNRGVIKSFRDFEKKMKDNRYDVDFGDVFEEEGVKITLIRSHMPNNSYSQAGYYFKAEVGDKTFFVKRKNGFSDSTSGLGYNESDSTIKAKEVLSGMEGTEVVDFQLGYQDELNRATYFVSKWIDAISTYQHIEDIRINLGKIDPKLAEAEVSKFNNRVNVIIKKLSDFYDVGINNMLYDPISDKVIVFDVHQRCLFKK